MKFNEFERWLKSQGVKFKKGKKHSKLYLSNRRSTFPRHQTQDVGEDLRKNILKQLGLKD